MSEATPIPTQLIDLVGDGLFEIVPNTEVRHPFDADASGVVFSLSGRTYLVFEDPSDGYRSAAGPLLSFSGSAYELGGHSWSWPTYLREEVFCSHRTKGEFGGEDDVLEVSSKATGAVIFEVGTENVDDYYPAFVCRWSPEGLSTNAKALATPA